MERCLDPRNGLGRISAHPRSLKKLKPAASGTRLKDWIDGICYADSAGAHWVPVVLHQLQHKTVFDGWGEVVPDDILKQWQKAGQ